MGSEESIWTYAAYCAEPTFYEGLRFSRDLILLNVGFRLILQYANVPLTLRHTASLFIGLVTLYLNVGIAVVWTFCLTFGSYFILICSSTLKCKGMVIAVTVILFLLSCEVYIVNPKMWQQIRGIQMIAAMKIISVAVELDRGLFKNLLTPTEFAGYVLCPANCVLGPWISFSTYKSYLNSRFLSRRWFLIIVMYLGLSIMYLLMSNCVIPWYIDDDSSKWLVAYRDAQAFRMSHYFVSSLSVVTMVSAGFGLTNNCHIDCDVTKPSFIELPRSLVQVVIFWNIPMHKWLKTYVFKSCQPYGQFYAIFVTYAVSSLLHGLNFQLSAVLLSIGMFSYVEYKLRTKVSNALEACCLASPCSKQCDHIYKNNSVLSIFINSIFSIVTIIHLAYLGVMFEASFSLQESGYSYEHTLSKWENLDYFSHGFVAFLYVVFLAL